MEESEEEREPESGTDSHSVEKPPHTPPTKNKSLSRRPKLLHEFTAPTLEAHVRVHRKLQGAKIDLYNAKKREVQLMEELTRLRQEMVNSSEVIPVPTAVGRSDAIVKKYSGKTKTAAAAKPDAKKP